MKFDENLAAIHGYLCGDGYVIKNPETQNHRYYHIGFRNTNLILLKDFQKRFKNFFDIKPRIYRNERSITQNKEIYYKLTKCFSFYSRKWEVPKLSKELLKFWLRAFFDCEAWVEVQKAKSRAIRLDSINKKGLYQIKKSLFLFNVKSSIKIRKNKDIWRMNICGKENLLRFYKKINFLHPKKRIKLISALNSYSK